MDNQNLPPPDLLEAQKLAYNPSGLTSHSFLKEKESKDYGAFDIPRIQTLFS